MTGRELHAQALQRGWDCAGFTRAELDISNLDAVRKSVEEFKPDVVINAAAYTAVDDAEKSETDAMRVNGDGATNVAVASSEHDAAVIQI